MQNLGGYNASLCNPGLTVHYAQLWCPQFKQKDENCKGSSTIHKKYERELKREVLAE